MAKFRVTAPDGTLYSVEAPDQATAIASAQAQHPPSPQDGSGAASAPSMLDYLRTNPVVGAPLQTLLRSGQGIEQLLAHGAAAASDLGGYAPNPVSAHLRALSDAVDGGINAQNADYEAAKQRVIDASTNPAVTAAATGTGEFAGNLLNPVGAAGDLVKAAPGVLNSILRSAASGAAFGASQPVMDNPDYWTQKAVQTGAGAGLTTAGLKAAASDAYKQAESEGVVIRQPSVVGAVGDIANALDEKGIDPALQPKTTAVLNRFQAEANNGDLTLQRAETLRRIANSALDSPDKSDRMMAHIVIDKWDDFIGGLKPSDMAGGVTADPGLAQSLNLPLQSDPQPALDALSQARDLYARSAKAQTLEGLVTRAQNAVGANYTTAGYETALRQKFSGLANNDAAMRRFSPDEQTAILQVVRGSPAENALRMIGKMAVRGPVSAIPAGMAFYSGGPEAAAALAAGGEAAKWGATQMALKNVNNAISAVRNGSAVVAQGVPGPAPAASVISPVTAFMLRSILQPGAQ